MFEAIVIKGVNANPTFFREQTEPLCLIVATVCSGTEAPLLALDLLQDAFHTLFRTKTPFLLYQHQFSCEIEPFKQSFIRRNYNPPIIFRNVVELGASGATRA